MVVDRSNKNKSIYCGQMGERQTSLDILRIYATLQVVIFHLCNFFGYNKPSPINMYALLCVFSKTNNYHFMSISGYIGTKTKFAFSKLIPLALQTVFYSLFLYLVGIFFLKKTIYTKWNLVKMMFPLANGQYWYVFPYMIWEVLFSLLYPILSKLDTRYYKTICIIFLWVHALPWVGFYGYVGLDKHQSIAPFIVMGLISSYFGYHFKETSKLKLVMLIILYIILFYYNFLVHQKPEYFETEWKILMLFGDRTIKGLPAIMLALCSFYITISIKGQFKCHSFIQAISQCSLGVFMFHSTSFVCSYWVSIARKHYDRFGHDHIFFFCYSVKICIVGVLIDIARQHIFNTLVFKRNYFQVFTQYFDYFLMNKPLQR